MSAQLESMFFVGSTPWHGEGTKIPDDKNLSVKEGLTESGCDWEVHLEDLVTVNSVHKSLDDMMKSSNPQLEIFPNVDHRAVVRSTDNSVLGVVGPRYTPLQNKEAFEWFQPFLDANTCKLHTAGSLCNGKKVWVLAELNKPPMEIVKGDEVNKYILLSNSHDGTTSIRVGSTPVRVLCWNTLCMSHKDNASKLLRVKHTSNMKVSLDMIRDIMNEANASFEATAEQYRFLASKSVSVADLNKYVKIVMGIDDTKKIPTRTQNTLDKIVSLCEFGLGNNLPGVKGTYWSAYNGVNEYLNYFSGRNVSNRLNNLWFGTGVNMNKLALETAIEMAG